MVRIETIHSCPSKTDVFVDGLSRLSTQNQLKVICDSHAKKEELDFSFLDEEVCSKDSNMSEYWTVGSSKIRRPIVTVVS